jgi:hypothetical protein
MGFKWFNQHSIGVICGKPKMFIEVGDELWHWFHMFYPIIGVERKTHFKDTLLSHWYTSNETQLQRWTFKLKSEGTQKKQGTRAHLRAPFKADMGCLSNFGPPKSHGRYSPGFVQKCGTDSKYSSQLLRCYITNKMMLYITSKMMLIFLFHLICSLDLSSSCTWPSPCNWLISMNRSPY